MSAAAPPPLLGLIVPPAHGQVPDDGPQLYAGRARFSARGLGIAAISHHGFAPVMRSIVDHALALRDAGAQAISLMGTSISFQHGAVFANELRDQLRDATGLPCTTMAHAIVHAMQTLGVQRIAVASSYNDELNQCLRDFLDAQGLVVTALRGLDMTSVDAVEQVSPQELMELGRSAYAQGEPADALLISCGGLRTLTVVPRIEAQLGCPVIASSPAGFWDLMCTAGLDPTVTGHGRLFERPCR